MFPRRPPERASIKRIIKTFGQEIKQLQSQIKVHIDNHPNLKEQSELLQTIPGVGEKTAFLLLSEIESERYSSQAGLTPRQAQSGTSLNATNLSKPGNRRIRKGLYFPAIVAARHNQIIKEVCRSFGEKRQDREANRVCLNEKIAAHCIRSLET